MGAPDILFGRSAEIVPLLQTPEDVLPGWYRLESMVSRWFRTWPRSLNLRKN